MQFTLIDTVLERSADRIVAVKTLTQAEEYLADHFPTFPVMPGVLMLEAMVQAARSLLDERGDGVRRVLGEVKAFKYGAMVRPGEALIVEVTVGEPDAAGIATCRGSGVVRRAGPDTAGDARPNATAASGRFTMRPVRR